MSNVDLEDLKRRLERLPASDQLTIAASLIVQGKGDLGWVIAENAVMQAKVEHRAATGVVA